jgi:hypothetical protein
LQWGTAAYARVAPSDGDLNGEQVQCPGYRFNIQCKDQQVVRDLAVLIQPVFQVKVKVDQIFL